MTKFTLLRGAAALALLGGTLAACGDDDNDQVAAPTPAPPPTATPAAFPDRFGTAVAASFGAAANTDARDPAAGDVPPLSLTTDPIDNS